MTTETKNRIIGAIIGDVVGSTFEFVNKIPAKFKLFRNACSFTDDTVLTVAIADALLHNRTFADAICDWGERYTYAGFGGSFREWKKRRRKDPSATNNSKGNGCGMRVCPVGFFANSIEEALELAKESALLTHNSPEGIAGAQAIAVAVFMAKEKRTKEEIKAFIENTFGYNLGMSNDGVRKFIGTLDSAGNTHREREWAENTCPVAITAFLNSCGYEETIRTAISYGGDVDTIACMAGGIAAAYYGVPDEIIKEVAAYLPQDIIEIVNEFDGLELANRNTPSQIDRWVKKGHVLVYGSGVEITSKTKTGSILRNNEPIGYIANRKFYSKHQLEGLVNNSYAIPTVGATVEQIKAGVERFITFVSEHPELIFLVTDIGCSKKAGFSPAEIAPLFTAIANNSNVYLPKDFREIIENI
jgi:ADP-ribosylglycohydrolase